MTREEAINEIKSWDFLEGKEIEAIHTLIPELAESEDERIRKRLIEYFEGFRIGNAKVKWEGLTVQDVLAWLEKQKELKPAESRKRNKPKESWLSEAKYEIEHADELLMQRREELREIRELKKKEQESESCEPDTNVEKVIEDVIRVYGKTQGEWVGGYDVDTLIVNLRRAFNKKEQHPSSRFRSGDWVVYDGPLGHAILQIGDVIDGRYTFVDNDSTLLVEDSDKFLRPLTPKDVEKSAESRKRNRPKESWLSRAKYEIEHADELLIQKQKELREIRELKKQEQKPVEKQDYSGLNDLERAILRGFLAAGMENVPVTIIKETAKECLAQMKPAEWSEEDKDMLNSCISSIEEAKENRYAYKETDGDTSYDHEIAWLKSLRPRWKPSDEQMKALCSKLPVVKGRGDKVQDILETLYYDLKKRVVKEEPDC